MITAEQLADRLGATRSGKGWRAQCPVHLGDSKSLTIDEGEDGRVLLKCRAPAHACSFEAICQAIQIEPRELMGDEIPIANGKARTKTKERHLFPSWKDALQAYSRSRGPHAATWNINARTISKPSRSS